MTFITLEDLYGSCEIIIFENCYLQCSNELIDENIVLVEGRLSIREDEFPTIIARNICKLEETKKKELVIDITDLAELERNRLRGALIFFSGDKNNIQVKIIDNKKEALAGGIYLTKEIFEELQEIVGLTNARIEEK